MSRRAGFLIVAFLLITLLIYGQALGFQFVTLDDGLLVYQNPTVQGVTLLNFVRAFTTYDPELYIPLTLLTYQLDFAIGGIDPFFYHLQNLLWHAANGVMVVFLVGCLLDRTRGGVRLGVERSGGVRLGMERSGGVPLGALCAGLLFLVHPINTEAAVWVAARKDLVSTFFFLFSLLTYLRGGRRFYVTSIAAFALALMGKVSTVTLPVVLILLDYLFAKRLRLIEKAPYLVLAIVFGIIALVGKSGGQPFSPTLAVMSIMFSLQKFFLPVQLSVGYPYTEAITATSPDFLLSLLGLLLLLTAIGFSLYRQWRILAFGLLFFLITLIPSFFNLSKGIENYLGADRYLYLPAIGLIILIGYGLSMIKVRTLSFASLLLMPLAVMAHSQSLTWQSSEALYRNVLRLYPESSGAHINLGNEFRRSGNFVAALSEYETAIALNDSPKAHYNKAIALESLGKTTEAIASYKAAIDRDSQYDYAHVNLGKLYYAAGRKEEALREFQIAVKNAPYLALAHFNIGFISAERGEFSAAVASYRRALAIDPSFVDARVNLVIALIRLGEEVQARQEYERLLRENPNHSSVQTLGRLLR